MTTFEVCSWLALGVFALAVLTDEIAARRRKP